MGHPVITLIRRTHPYLICLTLSRNLGGYIHSDHNVNYLMTYLGILGFPTHQNLEATTYDEICQAFLKRSKKIMRKRELAMEAEESKDPKQKVLYEIAFQCK